MSSLKRTNATSSELGQLKASDKWEPTSKTAGTSAANTTDTSADTMSSSTTTAKSPSQSSQQSRDAPKTASDTTQHDTKNINSLDEACLKVLLEEAISYKGPKDKENKSETFKNLLRTVEQEDKDRDSGSFLGTRQYRGNSRRHGYPNSYKGGSLQDLVDSDDHLDVDYLSSGQSKRHQQNSRYTKYSSSVSSRQREGGSLPTNVNHPVSFDSQFFNNRINTTISEKSKESRESERNATIHHNRNALAGDSINHNRDDIAQSNATTSIITSASSTNDKPHTIIDIEDPDDKSHILAHDSLAQGIITEAGGDEGTELEHLKKSRNQKMNHTATIDVMDKNNEFISHNNNSVDKHIDFFRLQISNPSSLLKTDSKISITNSKSIHSNPLQLNPKQFDENGNAISPKASQTKTSQLKNRKRNRLEKNVTTWTIEKVEGADAEDIDSIVAYVESGDTSKKQKIINVNKNNLSNQKEKKRSNKKEGDKLKRSTSMEDLRSSSNIVEESERTQVSLRQKQSTSQKGKANTAADGKEANAKQTNQQPANKRGERRSWGTEELNYLGERDMGEERDSKKQKDTKVKNVKISEQNPSVSASVESIPSEAAGFHVVTKKKKTKKRQILEEAKSKQQQQHQQQQFSHSNHYGRDHTHSGGRNANHPGNRYQPSSTYTNDRDAYLNSKTTQESRRKSTSSSDSSDLDSTHSLPVESSTSFKPLISYAEIARNATANQAEKQLTASAWPPVSQNPSKSAAAAAAMVETPTATIPTDSTSAKSQSSHRSNDAPHKSTPVIDDKSTPSDAKVSADTPKAPSTISETIKNYLQKSKSLDSEKYAATMNLDQFPDLEKTVKPPKFPQNFASVLASSPPTLDKPNKGQSTKKAALLETPTMPADNPGKKSIAAVVAAAAAGTATAVESEIKHTPTAPQPTAPANLNQAKLVFVQNSTKAEEIANSGTSNLFMSMNTLKKNKKQQQSSTTTNGTANLAAASNKNNNTNNNNSNTQRVAVVFSDQGGNNENICPLLFGDFNDDILQLMKQEVEMKDINGNPFDIIQSQGNNTDSATDATSKSDPCYASAIRTKATTESHEVLDIHQGFNDTSTTPTPTELNKKNTIAKRINLNKPNVNSNTSDVVSNQSIINMDNNQSVKNNRNYGDAGGRISNAQHTAPPSDSANLNNNVATIDNYTAARVNSDGDSTKAIHMVSNVNKLNAKVSGHQINRGGAVIMPTCNYVSNKHSHESNAFNERKHFNQLTGKLISSAATAAYMTNDIPPFTNCVETRLPLSFAHNHEDIVNYVVSAWEETVSALKSGRACYFTGQ